MIFRMVFILGVVISLLEVKGVGSGAAVAGRPIPAEIYYRYTPDAFRKIPAVQQKVSYQRLNLPLLNAAVFHETNVRRARHGLKPLKWDLKAQQVAAMHTSSMAMHEFISHDNNFDPRKKTLADRLKLANVSPQFAAENLATAFALDYESGTSVYVREEQGRTVYSLKPNGPALPMRTYQQFASKLVDSWMNSPGHRKNLLHEAPELLGAACLPEKKEDGIRKFYCTQIFLKL